MKNPTNYEHRTIFKGFQDEKLFEEKKWLFNCLGDNNLWYIADISSYAKKSFNATIVSKAPKTSKYGMSQSDDFWIGFRVDHKNNKVHKSNAEVNKSFRLSPGVNTGKRCLQADRKAKNRYETYKTKEITLQIRMLKKAQTNSRNRIEDLKSVTF